MVASIPYVNATEPHMLDTYAPEVRQTSAHSLALYWLLLSADHKSLFDFKIGVSRSRAEVGRLLLVTVTICDHLMLSRDGLDDPLDDMGLVGQQLDQV